MANFIAICAFLLSFWSIKKTIAFNKKQEEFNKKQEEINKIVLKQKQREELLEHSANPSASIIKLNSRAILKIFNKGKAVAKNVTIKLPDDIDNLAINGLTEKLPINLEEHQHVDFEVMYSMNTKRKIKCTLTWDDNQMINNQKEIELTL